MMDKSYLEMVQIHKDNRLAGLHPATKFLVVILYCVSTYVVSTVRFTRVGLPLLLIPWFLVVFSLCIASGALKKGAVAMKAIAFLALAILAVQALIVPGGEVLWRCGFLRICEGGLKTGVSLALAIIDVAGIFVWFFQTTENKEITRALEDSGMNHKMTYVFTSSLSMINELGRNSEVIMNAQRARGVETQGNVIVRAKAFMPTLVPLILSAVIGAEERVLTLEARGFTMTGERTHLFTLEKSGLEGIVKTVSIAVTVLLIVGRVALWIL